MTHNRKRYHHGGVGNSLKVKYHFCVTGRIVSNRRYIKEENDLIRKNIKSSDFSYWK